MFQYVGYGWSDPNRKESGNFQNKGPVWEFLRMMLIYERTLVCRNIMHCFLSDVHSSLQLLPFNSCKPLTLITLNPEMRTQTSNHCASLRVFGEGIRRDA